MVHIRSIDTLNEILRNFEEDKITFQIIGDSYEGQGVYGFGNENSILNVRLVILSTVGELYYSEAISLSDSDKVTRALFILETFLRTSADVIMGKDGVVEIK